MSRLGIVSVGRRALAGWNRLEIKFKRGVLKINRWGDAIDYGLRITHRITND